MKHPYITDPKYKYMFAGMIVFSVLSYLAAPMIFAHITVSVFALVVVIGYFAMKK